jgi:transposase-like protein
MIRRKISLNKQQIISEYLTGGETFQALSVKYGVNARTIQTWVRAFRKQQPLPAQSLSDEGDVKALKKQLAQAELKNELLEEMLRLAEEQAGIDFRKKFGSGQ